MPAPSQGRRDGKSKVEAIGMAKVGVDAIVGSYLRQRSGAAGPVILFVDFASAEAVVGVIESTTVGQQRLGAQHRVVHYAFHAVAVSRVAHSAKQVARQFKVGIGAAGRLKAAVRGRQAGGELSTVWPTKRLVRPPASRREALRRQHFESVTRRAQVFGAS